MPSLSDFIIETNDEQILQLARQWLWLTGEPMMPIMVTLMGDYFAQGEGDEVFFIDTAWGKCEQVAASSEEFDELLAAPEITDWFYFELAGALLTAGARRLPSQCFSFMLAPMLGGKVELANVEPCDLVTHSGINAQIARQLTNMPVGTKIRNVRMLDDGSVSLDTE
jgi:hypothetical protein